MLKSLNITNYALIDELNIRFSGGMTVLTGETGAGKSIIIGALSLILGQRADTKAIKTDAEKCIIEAEFEISAYKHLKKIFVENELDYDSEICIIRREITNNGKSRAFINDTPTGLNVVKDITSELIDIHSQHENLLISNENFQLEFVDDVADNTNYLIEYQNTYKNWLAYKYDLKNLNDEISRQSKEFDFIQFQLMQLNNAQLIEGELEELETELKILTHAEEIKTELSKCALLLNSDESVLPLLKDSITTLNKVSVYLNDGNEWQQRLQSVYIELKDLVDGINSEAEKTEYNPQRLNEVEVRLNELYTLLKKFKVANVGGLIEIRNQYSFQLNKLETYDEVVAELEDKLKKTEELLAEKSQELSKSRKNVFPAIELYLVEHLKTLGMPYAKIEINLIKLNEFQPNGNDLIQFLFSANKNRSLQPVQLIASGGEISRFMLAVKSLMAKKKNLPAIIFDEIDTGVSGEIAHKMGEIMQNMSREMQVICITHLPQIAAKGNEHFKVYKDDTKNQTTTHIRLLNENERIEEIAEMLSGKNPSHAARQNAMELLRM